MESLGQQRGQASYARGGLAQRGKRSGSQGGSRASSERGGRCSKTRSCPPRSALLKSGFAGSWCCWRRPAARLFLASQRRGTVGTRKLRKLRPPSPAAGTDTQQNQPGIGCLPQSGHLLLDKGSALSSGLPSGGSSWAGREAAWPQQGHSLTSRGAQRGSMLLAAALPRLSVPVQCHGSRRYVRPRQPVPRGPVSPWMS